MDLSSLANNISEFFKPGSSAIYTAPGQSYGPAVSRLTRVPIQFTPGSGGDLQSGLYFTPQKISSVFKPMVGNVATRLDAKPSITINPTSQDMQDNYHGDVNAAIKHEIAHSIVEPAMDGNTEKLATGNPQYNNMLLGIAGKRDGFMPSEIPAYAAEPNPGQYGFDPATRAQYIQKLLTQLPPDAAAKYKRLVGNR